MWGPLGARRRRRGVTRAEMRLHNGELAVFSCSFNNDANVMKAFLGAMGRGGGGGQGGGSQLQV